jgi:hypothetical protein
MLSIISTIRTSGCCSHHNPLFSEPSRNHRYVRVNREFFEWFFRSRRLTRHSRARCCCPDSSIVFPTDLLPLPSPLSSSLSRRDKMTFEEHGK